MVTFRKTFSHVFFWVKVKVVSAFFQDELQEVFTRLGCKVSASELGKVLKDADANKATPWPFSVAVAVFLGGNIASCWLHWIF